MAELDQTVPLPGDKQMDVADRLESRAWITGTILTSVIAASAATIGVVVTKDSKISKFRQEWIDALREDVARLCSVSVALFQGNVRCSVYFRQACEGRAARRRLTTGS